MLFELYSGYSVNDITLAMPQITVRQKLRSWFHQPPLSANFKLASPEIIEDHCANITVTYTDQLLIEIIRLQYFDNDTFYLDSENISSISKDDLKLFLANKGLKSKRIDGKNVYDEIGFAYSSYRSSKVNFFYIFPKGQFKRISAEHRNKMDNYQMPILKRLM
ncbi:hypothetical protein [uncultured Agitococcus sp.]|uniref:hypothetical protein n=1 Tax=uncultured Agitococcus sp. TaxID=1506599 RepID=UPI00260A9D94|nr:hypothetical protein [uncultured Agitococcus sp.]